MSNPNLLTGLPSSPLSPEEEQAIATNKTPEGLEKLILHSMRDAFLYGNKCAKRLPEDEVYSACYTALSRAAKSFQPGQIRFIGYSKVFIRGEICTVWKSKDVVKNSSQHETLPMTSDELPRRPAYGSDDPLVGNQTNRVMTSNPRGSTLVEPTTEDDTENQVFTAEMMAIIKPMMEQHLTPREREVLSLRYEQELSFEEIGELLGVSRSATQASHSGAIDKLRRALKFSKKVL